MANGERVADNFGVAIACPPHIDIGTRIFIPGVGDRICKDRGGAIECGTLGMAPDECILDVMSKVPIRTGFINGPDGWMPTYKIYVYVYAQAPEQKPDWIQ